METVETTDERSQALVVATSSTEKFGQYAEARDKWLATPIAHNTTLARGGYPFTILECTERTFEATALDEQRGYKVGDPIQKIAYLCVSQMTWWHYPTGPEEDIEYPKGEMFIILFNVNPIRERDYERVQELLKEGPVYNICLQEYPNKTKGFNPAHGLVTAQQWESLG